MSEITAPIIAITLVLLSVFVPVAFIPGISGQLYQQFAVAVSVSMVISAINALTLSPALCSVLLKRSHGPKRGPMRYVLGGIDKARDGYAAIVRAPGPGRLPQPRRARRRHRRHGLAVQRIAPTGFLPDEDQGAFFVEVQLPEGASVNRTVEVIKQVEEHGRRTRRASPASRRSSGYSFLDGLAKSNCALPGPDAQAVRGAHRAGGARRCICCRVADSSSRRFREAIVIPFNLPPIIGLGTGGGFEFQLLDLQGGDPGRSRRRPRGA